MWMPVLVTVGEKDALFDSAHTRHRIETLLSNEKIKHLDEAGHLVIGQDPAIETFLNGSSMEAPSGIS